MLPFGWTWTAKVSAGIRRENLPSVCPNGALKTFESEFMNKRTEYQKEYMWNYRAKQRETRTTAINNPIAENGCMGFTDRQLEQLRGRRTGNPANADNDKKRKHCWQASIQANSH